MDKLKIHNDGLSWIITFAKASPQSGADDAYCSCRLDIFDEPKLKALCLQEKAQFYHCTDTRR